MKIIKLNKSSLPDFTLYYSNVRKNIYFSTFYFCLQPSKFLLLYWLFSISLILWWPAGYINKWFISYSGAWTCATKRPKIKTIPRYLTSSLLFRPWFSDYNLFIITAESTGWGWDLHNVFGKKIKETKIIF